MGEVLIKQIGGGIDSDGSTATKQYVLAGKTYVGSDYNEDTEDETGTVGTMTNQGQKTATLGAGGSYTIPKGKHDGTGYVSIKTVASQTSGGTAAASTIWSGYKAYVNGSLITGTGGVTNISSSWITGSGTYANANGKLIVNWSNPSSGFWNGVELSYSNGTVITRTSASSYTVTGLSKGTTYTFRLRSYVILNGSYVYSGFQTTSLKGTTWCTDCSCNNDDCDGGCVAYCQTC